MLKGRQYNCLVIHKIFQFNQYNSILGEHKMCKKRKTNLLAGLIWLYVLMSLKCVKKTGSQLYYLSSMLCLNLIIRMALQEIYVTQDGNWSPSVSDSFCKIFQKMMFTDLVAVDEHVSEVYVLSNRMVNSYYNYIANFFSILLYIQ